MSLISFIGYNRYGKTMKVAIIAAMEQEVELLRSQIDNMKTEQYAGFDFYSGTIANCEIILVKSGIGKVAAATGTSLLLSHYEVDVVINTGSAGGLASNLNIGDVVVSTEVLYHDADLTPFGYVAGQMAGCPAVFLADKHYRQLAKSCITDNQVNAVEGAIASGDSFINGSESIKQIKTNFPTAVAVEMEAAAIGHVCWLFNMPFVVVRAVSDNGDSESAMDFDEFLPLAAKQSSLIVKSMLQKISQVS